MATGPGKQVTNGELVGQRWGVDEGHRGLRPKGEHSLVISGWRRQ